MRYALAVFLLMLAACGSPRAADAKPDADSSPEDACIDLEDQGEITLAGKLTTQLFAGPPNYESIAAGDSEERAFILELSDRICVEDTAGFTDPGVRFDRVHVTANSEEDLVLLRSAVGRDVTVTGEGMGAHTGHHRAPLVLFMGEISIEGVRQESRTDQNPDARQAGAPALPAGDANGHIFAPGGWGRIRIGQSVAAARQASGLELEYSASHESTCGYLSVPGTNIGMMVEDGAITTIEAVGGPNSDARSPVPVRTTEGVGLGSTERAVRGAYSNLTVEEAYDPAPGDKYLIVGTPERGDAILFEIRDGVVQTIKVGGTSILYYEGCS